MLKYLITLAGLVSTYLGYLLAEKTLTDAMLAAFDGSEPNLIGLYFGGLLAVAGMLAVLVGTSAIGYSLERKA